MNYAELSQAIQDYTETYEQVFVANIPTFVQQAEERIYNTVQIPSLRKNVLGTITSGNKYLACPNDYLSTFSLAVVDGDGNYEYLLNKDVNYIREAYPNPNDTGIPKYYALFGPQRSFPRELAFILGPTPNENYTAELHYFYYPESIVISGESWLGDNYSPVLLYGALREAVIFQKGEQDMVAYYEKQYQEAIQQLNRLGTGLERQDAYRSGQARIPVNP
jgi:hypothetical protein